MIRHWRFVVSVVLLGATALVLQARNGAEIIPARPALLLPANAGRMEFKGRCTDSRRA